MSEILVKISLLKSEEGGRKGPILHLRDFGCPVFFRGIPALSAHDYDCRLIVQRIGRDILPGETVDGVPIRFLSADEVVPNLMIGTRFELWDGHVIGEGEVTAMTP